MASRASGVGSTKGAVRLARSIRALSAASAASDAAAASRSSALAYGGDMGEIYGRYSVALVQLLLGLVRLRLRLRLRVLLKVRVAGPRPG